MIFDFYFWKLAERNLRRHFRRNLSTGLAIGLGFAGIVLLGGYLLRMERYLATQSIYLNHRGHISIYRPEGVDRHLADPIRYSLNSQDQKYIEETVGRLSEQPEFVAKFFEGQGLVSNGCLAFPFLGFAVEPEIEARIRNHPEVLNRIPELSKISKGRGFWEVPFEKDGILLSSRLTNRLRKPLLAGDPSEDLAAMNAIVSPCNEENTRRLISTHSGVQLVGSSFSKGLAAADARILGIFSTGLALSDDTALTMPLGLAQSFFETDSVTSMALYLRDTSRIKTERLANELRSFFSQRRLAYDVYPYFDERVSPYYVGAMTFVYIMTVFFLVLVCGVAALAILNALQISFMERRTEIGTLRALGFSSHQITGLFAREVFLLTTLALTLGGVFAFIASATVNHLNLRFFVPGLAGSLSFLLQPGILFSLLIAIVFFAFLGVAVLIAGNRWKKLKVIELLETK